MSSSPEALSQDGSAFLTIVVTAFNNEDTIVKCIETLQKQTYQSKTLTVVADEASSDKTLEVLSQSGALERVKLIKCKGVGRSEARNIGWKDTRADVVMFADGDDVYDPEYARRAMDLMSKDQAFGGVCLGGAPLMEGDGVLMRYQDSFGSTDERRKSTINEPDWAFVYRREALAKVGGFDISLSQAEDRDLCSRVKSEGYHIGYIGGVNWFHRKPGTMKEFLGKEFRAGRSRVVYEKKRDEYLSIAAAVAPVAFLALMIPISVVSPKWGVGLFILGLFGYLALASAKRVKRTSASDIIPFAFISLAGKLAEALGSTEGLMRFSPRNNMSAKQ
ncbi:MAG TPA: glycosyltransferase [Nitrososphaerales archaeon]|nr:glycosyltransferase [Nitrososphaerales archaeon]